MSDRPEDFLELRSKLKDPGVTQVSASGVTEAPPTIPLNVEGTSTLKDLLADFSFYSPALLHLTVPLTFDPFDLFCAESEREIQRYSFHNAEAMFGGLVHPTGDVSWNHGLFALRKEDFDLYLKWIGCCAFNDFKRNLLRRVRTQEVTILDPLAKANGKMPLPIPVTMLVIETNVGSFYFKTDVRTWIPCATFDDKLVYADTTAFSEALRIESANPYDFIERETHVRKDLPSGSDGG